MTEPFTSDRGAARKGIVYFVETDPADRRLEVVGRLRNDDGYYRLDEASGMCWTLDLSFLNWLRVRRQLGCLVRVVGNETKYRVIDVSSVRSA